jgi:streptogramin lyase
LVTSPSWSFRSRHTSRACRYGEAIKGHQRVRTLTSAISEISTPGVESFNMAAGPDGSVWYTAADAIGRVSVTGGSQLTIPSAPEPAGHSTTVMSGSEAQVTRSREEMDTPISHTLRHTPPGNPS